MEPTKKSTTASTSSRNRFPILYPLLCRERVVANQSSSSHKYDALYLPNATETAVNVALLPIGSCGSHVRTKEVGSTAAPLTLASNDDGSKRKLVLSSSRPSSRLSREEPEIPQQSQEELRVGNQHKKKVQVRKQSVDKRDTYYLTTSVFNLHWNPNLAPVQLVRATGAPGQEKVDELGVMKKLLVYVQPTVSIKKIEDKC